jgi:hypothetical protein
MRLFVQGRVPRPGVQGRRVGSLRQWAPAYSMVQRPLLSHRLPDIVPQWPIVRSVAARGAWRPFRVGSALRARTLSVRAKPLPAHLGSRAPQLYQSGPRLELNPQRWSRRKAWRMPSLRRLREGKLHSKRKTWQCLSPRRDEGYHCVHPADGNRTGCPPPLST